MGNDLKAEIIVHELCLTEIIVHASRSTASLNLRAFINCSVICSDISAMAVLPKFYIILCISNMSIYN